MKLKRKNDGQIKKEQICDIYKNLELSDKITTFSSGGKIKIDETDKVIFKSNKKEDERFFA